MPSGGLDDDPTCPALSDSPVFGGGGGGILALGGSGAAPGWGAGGLDD